MIFNQESAELFIPDGLPGDAALARTTHLGVGAHPDDLEIMALSGIMDCFQREDKWFCGVVVTDGRGSPRDGLYKDYSDEAMRVVRRKEQKKAAIVGEYAAQVLLDYPDSSEKSVTKMALVEDLQQILQATEPKVVYSHNLADKHDMHVGVTLSLVEAIRKSPQDIRPKRLFGCEVWRDLDWLVDQDKVTFDVSAHENLQAALLGVFDSQISGGKRYDLATMGRRRANATYFASHGTDIATGMIYAMDLSPLIDDLDLEPEVYMQGYIERFSMDIYDRINRLQQ